MCPARAWDKTGQISPTDRCQRVLELVESAESLPPVQRNLTDGPFAPANVLPPSVFSSCQSYVTKRRLELFGISHVLSPRISQSFVSGGSVLNCGKKSFQNGCRTRLNNASGRHQTVLDLRQLWDAMRGRLSSVSTLDRRSHLVAMLTAPYGELWESCFDSDGLSKHRPLLSSAVIVQWLPRSTQLVGSLRPHTSAVV